MVSLVVETGEIVEGANSYVTVDEFTHWLSDRGYAVEGDPATLLFNANMNFLEFLDFKGTKRTKDQDLQWPRCDVSIDGQCYKNSEIPNLLKNAQMSIAYIDDKGYGPMRIIERSTKREKIEGLEIEYFEGGSSTEMDPMVFSSIRKLIKGGGPWELTVYR